MTSSLGSSLGETRNKLIMDKRTIYKGLCCLEGLNSPEYLGVAGDEEQVLNGGVQGAGLALR